MSKSCEIYANYKQPLSEFDHPVVLDQFPATKQVRNSAPSCIANQSLLPKLTLHFTWQFPRWRLLIDALIITIAFIITIEAAAAQNPIHSTEDKWVVHTLSAPRKLAFSSFSSNTPRVDLSSSFFLLRGGATCGFSPPNGRSPGDWRVKRRQ